MARNILYLVTFLFVTLSCSRTNVEISGEITDGGQQKVYLEQLNVDRNIVIDSAKTNKKGRFKLRTLIEEPTFYNVRIGQKEFVTIIAVPDEKIELTGNYKGLSQNYWVDGSENSLWIKLLNFQLHHTRTAMDSLMNKYKALPATAVTEKKQIAAAWDSVIHKQISFSKDFILKHAISPASYYALYQKFNNNDFILTPEEDLHSYKIVASSLRAMYPESQYTKAILKHLNQISKEAQTAKIREFIATSESSLPAIRMENAQGDTIALSSLKGKYIILDFTVLNSRDGAAYAADLKKVYNKFKNRGVRIYQVCMDEDKTLWKNRVKQYGIDWTCVYDPDGLQSRTAAQWNIKSVPANYIINPAYEIAGKNLTGQRLEERLNDLLK